MGKGRKIRVPVDPVIPRVAVPEKPLGGTRDKKARGTWDKPSMCGTNDVPILEREQRHLRGGSRLDSMLGAGTDM